mmetsp:Transcript_59196/g.155838  ORF Transcript_59196/g.155838 Transcript_59196/m.155838 type:complete len:153 (-) Transcript_59196:718-1176(-)
MTLIPCDELMLGSSASGTDVVNLKDVSRIISTAVLAVGSLRFVFLREEEHDRLMECDTRRIFAEEVRRVNIQPLLDCFLTWGSINSAASTVARLMNRLRAQRSPKICGSAWTKHVVRGKMSLIRSSATTPAATGSTASGVLAGGGRLRAMRK